MKKKLLMTLAIVACATLLVVGSIAGTLAYLRAMAQVSNTFTYGKVGISMDETKINQNDQKTPEWDAARGTGNTYLLMPDSTYVKDPVIHVAKDSQDMYLFVKIDNGIAGLAVEDAADQHLTIHNQMLAHGWKIYSYTDTENQTITTYDKQHEKETNAGVTMISRSTVYYLAVPNGTAPQLVNEAFEYSKQYKTDYTTGNGTYLQQTIGEKVEYEGDGVTVKSTTPIKQDYAKGDIPTFETFTTGTSPVTESSMTAYINNGASIVITAYAVQAEANEFKNFDAVAAVFTAEWTTAANTKPITTP